MKLLTQYIVEVVFAIMLEARLRLVVQLAVGFVALWSWVNGAFFLAMAIGSKGEKMTLRTLRVDILAICLAIGHFISTLSIAVFFKIFYIARKTRKSLRDDDFDVKVYAYTSVVLLFSIVFIVLSVWAIVSPSSSDELLFAPLLGTTIFLLVPFSAWAWIIYRREDGVLWGLPTSDEQTPLTNHV